MYSNHWFQFFLVFLYDHCIELSLGLPSFVLVPLTSSAFFRNFPVYIFLSPFFFTLRGMFRPFSAERRGGGLEVLGGRTMARKPRPGGGAEATKSVTSPSVRAAATRREDVRQVGLSQRRNIFFPRQTRPPPARGGSNKKWTEKEERDQFFHWTQTSAHNKTAKKTLFFLSSTRVVCVCVCVSECVRVCVHVCAGCEIGGTSADFFFCRGFPTLGDGGEKNLSLIEGQWRRDVTGDPPPPPPPPSARTIGWPRPAIRSVSQNWIEIAANMSLCAAMPPSSRNPRSGKRHRDAGDAYWSSFVPS